MSIASRRCLTAGLSKMSAHPDRALRLLDDALAEWAGPALAEFDGEPWALPHAARLTELQLHAREERLTALLGMGLDERAIGEGEALTAEHPWREQPWRALVVALHRVGRQGDALQTASVYRSRLREERGLDPSEEFVALERQVATDEPTATEAGASGPRQARGEAARRVELIGRDRDVTRIRALCADQRLVTLLGPGGIGKTQLARQVVAELSDTWVVTQVELAPVRDETSVVAAIATQLGLQVQHSRSVLESIVDLLSEPQNRLLLVLDNCEHVLEATAAFVERLLSACPMVTVLTTSRVPLGLPQESVYKVPALLVPHTDAEPDARRTAPAVALFLRRAAAANPDQVSRRCDGAGRGRAGSPIGRGTARHRARRRTVACPLPDRAQRAPRRPVRAAHRYEPGAGRTPSLAPQPRRMVISAAGFVRTGAVPAAVHVRRVLRSRRRREGVRLWRHPARIRRHGAGVTGRPVDGPGRDRDPDDLSTAGDAPRLRHRDRLGRGIGARPPARRVARRRLRAGCGWPARPRRARMAGHVRPSVRRSAPRGAQRARSPRRADGDADRGCGPGVCVSPVALRAHQLG